MLLNYQPLANLELDGTNYPKLEVGGGYTLNNFLHIYTI